MTKPITYFVLLYLTVLYGTAIASEKCSEIDYSSGYNEARPVKNKPELVHSHGPLLDGGKVTCKMSTNYDSLPLTNQLLRIETGEYKGVKYRFYYSDGSGSVQGLEGNNLDILTDPPNSNWNIICKADGMDDTAWCSILKDDLTVTVWKDGSPVISIGNNHFPGTNYSLRIDGQEVFETRGNQGFLKDKNAKIIEQLLHGDTVLTRYVEWPYEAHIDKKTDLFGLSVAYELSKKIRQHMARK